VTRHQRGLPGHKHCCTLQLHHAKDHASTHTHAPDAGRCRSASAGADLICQNSWQLRSRLHAACSELVIWCTELVAMRHAVASTNYCADTFCRGALNSDTLLAPFCRAAGEMLACPVQHPTRRSAQASTHCTALHPDITTDNNTRTAPFQNITTPHQCLCLLDCCCFHATSTVSSCRHCNVPPCKPCQFST
jgi:hypothetical protein